MLYYFKNKEKILFTVKVVKYWNRLPKNLVEIIKGYLDIDLSNLL